MNLYLEDLRKQELEERHMALLKLKASEFKKEYRPSIRKIDQMVPAYNLESHIDDDRWETAKNVINQSATQSQYG